MIEDDCFIGARAEVAEGVIVREGSVLSMGVYLGASTRIVDRASGKVSYGEVPPYSVVVVRLDARRLGRAVALLRGDRQAGRREDARQDLHQRTPARLRRRGERASRRGRSSDRLAPLRAEGAGFAPVLLARSLFC